MGVKKTTFYKAKEASTEIEPITPDDPMMADTDGDCCICDDPATSGCVQAESVIGMVYTLAGAQTIAYWGMK